MAQNLYSEWYQGIGRSRSDTAGFHNLVNCDIHSELGYITPQSAIELDTSSNAPTEACIFCKSPSGTIYGFSTTTGKIWKYNGTAWSVITANTNTAHKGCLYYNGYIYYATQTTLGRFASETEASRDNNWHTTKGVSLTSSVYRPMEEVNLVLYIGNGNKLISVNSSNAINVNAFDCPPNYTVTALARAGVDLLVGTVVGSYVNESSVFLWDTYSDSWTIEDTIPEIGVNAFIKSDDTLFAQCGVSGQLYYWSGTAMVRFRKLPDVTTTINPYNVARVGGRCLFAAGSKVFSIHRADNDLPYAVCQEYTTSSGNVNSMTTYGSTLLVSAATHVDKLGTAYGTAYIDTPESTGMTQQVIVHYDSLPSNTSIGIGVQIDHSGSFTSVVTKTDTKKKMVYFDGGLGDVNFFQARITMTPYGTTRPKIRVIETK